MKRKTIDIITLGCSKNLVDSEHLMRQLEEVGIHVTHDAERPKGQIAVINTCGFIGEDEEPQYDSGICAGQGGRKLEALCNIAFGTLSEGIGR